MRVIVIATALLAAQASRAGSVPFPEIDSSRVCEEYAQKAPDQLRGILGNALKIDAEKVKENARVACLKAQDASRKEVRKMWDGAPDAVRRACQAKAANYAELGLCLLQKH
jgi:hypothetical protein